MNSSDITTEALEAYSKLYPSRQTLDLGDIELFLKCWSRQDCGSCLASSDPCSWCAISEVCVPNTQAAYPFQILAPLSNDNICPMGLSEKWEMRAKPFSCKCSSMTLISVVVTVFATLATLIVLQILKGFVVWTIQKCRGRKRKRQPLPEIRIIRVDDVEEERRPLLRSV